jgi:hypothetical protein
MPYASRPVPWVCRRPIQYRLSGTTLVSHVKYSNPLLGEGWLSAGGNQAHRDEAVQRGNELARSRGGNVHRG